MAAQAQDPEAHVQKTIKRQDGGMDMREEIALKLLSFYFICQGLLLAGVTSNSSLTCRQFSLAFGTSSFVAVAFLIQMLENAWKYKESLIEVKSHIAHRRGGMVFMVVSLIFFLIFTAVTLVYIREIDCVE